MTSITVKTTNGASVEVDAEVFGQYAAHRAVYKAHGSDDWECRSYWAVTHVPSGMAVPYSLTKEAAGALAMYLAHHPRTEKTATSSDIEAVAKAVRAGFQR